MIMKMRELLNENQLKPNDFKGAIISVIYYSESEGGWVIITNKGTFVITKKQSFVAEQ